MIVIECIEKNVYKITKDGNSIVLSKSNIAELVSYVVLREDKGGRIQKVFDFDSLLEEELK